MNSFLPTTGPSPIITVESLTNFKYELDQIIMESLRIPSHLLEAQQDMTEHEWLMSTDPRKMVQWLLNGRGNLYRTTPDGIPIGVSQRKLRLFACAVVRQQWEYLIDQRSKHAVNVGERMADGIATEKEISRAVESVDGTMWEIAYGSPAQNATHDAYYCVGDAAAAVQEVVTGSDRVADTIQVAILRDIIGNPFRKGWYCRECGVVGQEDVYDAEGDGKGHSGCWKSVIDRVAVGRKQLVWNDGQIPKMAKVIYEHRTFDQLPILADAFEDAGCVDQVILNHCRSDGVHVRGCYVLDLLLGKE